MNVTFRIASLIIERAKRRQMVASGPFKGASLTPSALEHEWNKLMGVYEFYLHHALERAIASQPPVIIDVGAAEGFYTLGLAHRLPASRHIAYEMIDQTREVLLHSARSLEPSIQVKGRCTLAELTSDVKSSERGFLLMDCEGYEEHLLTSSIHAPLAGWHILLEVHDFQAPGAGEKILELFSSSHDVAIINSRQPDLSALSTVAPWPLNALCLKTFQGMFEEGRNCAMRFFYFTPNH